MKTQQKPKPNPKETVRRRIPLQGARTVWPFEFSDMVTRVRMRIQFWIVITIKTRLSGRKDIIL